MSRQLGNYVALPRLALAHGDSTPDPGKIGALAWSTTLLVVMSWNGSWWQAPSAFYDYPSSITYARPKYDVGRGVKLINLEGSGGAITFAANLVQGNGISITGTDTLTIANTKPGPATVLPGNQTSTSTTLANVTGSGLSVTNDKKYRFKYSVSWSAAATSSGISLAITAPYSPSGPYRCKIFGGVGGATVEAMNRIWDTKITLASCDVANAICYAEIEGVAWFTAGSGTMYLQYAATTAGVGATIKLGTIGEIVEMGP